MTSSSTLLEGLAQPSDAATDTAEHQYRRLVCEHCGAQIDIPVYCGNRFCDVCTIARRMRTRARLTELIQNVKPTKAAGIRFLTLTIPNTPDIDAGMLTLVRAFRRMRSRQGWKNHVTGGAFVLEVTGRPNNWHCHIHVVIEGSFFPVRLISAMWGKVSPGKIVWIQRIPKGVVVKYLTKYLSKSCLPQSLQQEVGEALKGYRLFQPFGSWHGIKLVLPKTRAVCKDCGHSSWIPEFWLLAAYDPRWVHRQRL